jgi:hypothetical protein
MFRVPVTFVLHRLLLLVVALAAINFSGPGKVFGEDSLPNIRSIDRVWPTFRERVEKLPELARLRTLLPLTNLAMVRSERSPFLWAAKLISRVTRLSPLTTLLLLSNLFFLLLLLETHQLLTRMVTEHMAGTVGICLILWPASYEMSLGSSLSLTCLLVVRAVRAAMDDSWWSAGVALALLILSEPVGIALAALTAYLFFYFQRHQPRSTKLKAAAFWIVPLAAALLWRGQNPLRTGELFSGSALVSLFSALKSQQVVWTFSHSQLGQTLTIGILLAGTVLGGIQAAVSVHKALIFGLFAYLLASSPYAELASRAPMAGICLTGLVGNQARLILQGILLLLGVHEVFAVFS